jgi:hypothetical protein
VCSLRVWSAAFVTTLFKHLIQNLSNCETKLKQARLFMCNMLANSKQGRKEIRFLKWMNPKIDEGMHGV